MIRNRSSWRIAAALAIGALFASQCWATEIIYVGAQGHTQGMFRGLASGPGKNMTQVTKFAFDVHVGLDPSTGLINGRRQYSPVRITKLLDASSAQYLLAAASNETLTNVTIHFYASDPSGVLMMVRTLVLTNAQVVAVEHFTEPDANGGPISMEQISLNFSQYTWTENSNAGALAVSDTIGGPLG